jgi:putative DNA primase/helicase
MVVAAVENLRTIKKNLLSPTLFRKTEHENKACFSYNYKQYGSFETWDLAWTFLKDLPPNENIFHELIMADRKVKPYLDIEWYTEKHPNTIPERVVLDIKEMIISIFANEWKKDISHNDIYVASCHRSKTEGYKNSFRMVVSTHPTIAFQSTNCAAYLGKRIRELCGEKFDENLIDMAVYHKQQNIRFVGHSKHGEYVPMQKMNSADDDKEFIITNVDPQWEILATPEQKDHKYKDIKNIKGIDFDNPDIVKYVMDKIRAVHPSCLIERIDANKFIQLNYTDRTESCFCKEDVKHERIGFFCYIQGDLICIGCHSGNCVDNENKKIIKIIGSISSTSDVKYEAVAYSNKFSLDHNFIKKCICDGSFGISNMFETMYLKPKRIKWINDTKTGSTFYWDGKLWKHDEYSFIERLITSTIVEVIRGFLKVYATADETLALDVDQEAMKAGHGMITKLNEGSNLNGILRFLKPLINDFDFDKIKDIHPYLLSCKNGVLDLKTGILRDGVPSDNMTRSLDIPYDEHARTEDFDKFVREITSSEEGEDLDLYNYVRWFIGYMLQGSPIKKTFFILYGALGYNGKSMLLNTIKSVLGFYAVAMDKSVILSAPQKTGGSHSSEICQLENSRAGLLTETSEDAIINDSQVKILTGITDKLSVREIYGKQKEFTPTFVPIISTNHKVKINLKDKAMFERVILIPFRLSFMEHPNPAKPYEKQADPYLSEKFNNNKEGILKWLIECSLFYHQNADLPVPETIVKAKMEYKREMDDYADFMERYLLPTGVTKDVVVLSDVLMRYKEFAYDNRIAFDKRKAEKMLIDCFGVAPMGPAMKFTGYKFKMDEEQEV